MKSVDWRKSDFWNGVKYNVLAFLSLGVIPIVTVFHPSFGLRLRTIPCDPDHADFIVTEIETDEGTKNFVSSVNHLENGSEHVVSFQANCQRFCASSIEEFKVYKVEDVPRNMKRFLVPQKRFEIQGGDEQDTLLKERDLLALKYGPNEMEIPPSDIFAITVRHALHPIIIFGYFSFIIWMIEEYWWWSTFLGVMVILTIIAMVEATRYNLRRLRELAGRHGDVELVDNSVSLVLRGAKGVSVGAGKSQRERLVINDSALIVGDRFLLREGLVLPCDVILVSGRVVVDESMLTGESIPVQKLPIDFSVAENADKKKSSSSSSLSVSGETAPAADDLLPVLDGIAPPPLLLEAQALVMPNTNEDKDKSGSKERSGKDAATAGDEEADADAEGGTGHNGDFVTPRIKILNAGEQLAEKHPGSVLYGGTKITYCIPGETVAVCYRTGYRSAKGQLISSLLDPHEGFLDFFNDMILVILFIFFIATALYIYQAAYLRSIGTDWNEIMILYFNALTVAIPITLMINIIISNMLSVYRLEQLEIYVSDTSKINYSALTSCVCFDKTGTLTEEHLEFKGAYVPSSIVKTGGSGGSNQGPLTLVDCGVPPETMYAEELIGSGEETKSGTESETRMTSSSSSPFPVNALEVMSCCHSLSVVSGSSSSRSSKKSGKNSGKFSSKMPEAVGDLLEVELLRASGWTLNMDDSRGRVFVTPSAQYLPEIRRISAASRSTGGWFSSGTSSSSSSGSSDSYEILRHFEFTSEKMRTSSVVRRPTGDIVYLSKGSPEVITSLCDPSTVPSDTTVLLDKLSRKGLRVIAMAYRSCSESLETLKSSTQEELEGLPPKGKSNKGNPGGTGHHGKLVYLGLLSLASRLKDDTCSTIDELMGAELHVNMITGDYVHTAIAVARDCGIIPSRESPYVTSNATPTSDCSCTGENIFSAFYIYSEAKKEEREMKGIRKGRSQSRYRSRSAMEKQGDVESGDHDTQYGDVLYIVDALPDSICSVSVVRSLDDRDVPVIPTDEKRADVALAKLIRESYSSKTVNFAVTGRGLAACRASLSPYDMHLLLTKAVVFARAKPDDKRSIVTELMRAPPPVLAIDYVGSSDDKKTINSPSAGANGAQTGTEITVLEPSPSGPWDAWHVMFCGDGANDMAALRACTVGVSLCDVETSIAAPITAKTPTPRAVILVLLEGRTSLVTTYVLVHYNIMTAMIVLFFTCVLYGYGLKVSDGMYFVQGFLYDVLSGIAIALNPSTDRLGPELPPHRYFTLDLMSVLIPQSLCFVGFQVLALYILSQQDFYVKYATDEPLTSAYSYETTVLDDIVLGQLMIASVVSTIGEPFRKEWYTNRWLVYSLIIQLAWLVYQVFAGSGYFPEELLGLEPIPTYFGFIILGLIAANAFLAGLLWMFAGRACRSYQRGVKRPVISQAAALPSSSKDSSPMKQNASDSQRVENKMKQYSGLGEAEEASPLLKK